MIVTNKNNLAHIVVGSLEQAKAFIPEGKRAFVKETVGNTKKANVYFAVRCYEYPESVLKQVYAAILNQNIVRIITGKDMVCYDSFDIADEDEREALASDVWDLLKDKKEALYPAQMDANYYDYIHTVASRTPDKVVCFTVPEQLKNVQTNKLYWKKVTKYYRASSIVRYYENAMKYAAPLGWTFKQPIIGHTRSVDAYNTLPVYDGKLDTFKTKGNAGAFISLAKSKYGAVVEHYPEMFEVTDPAAEVVITSSIRSKYKAVQMASLEEIIAFNWHLANLQDLADKTGTTIDEFFDPAWALCKHCGNPVRTEGKFEHRFCGYCDTEVRDYWAIDCYYDDGGYEDLDDRDYDYEELVPLYPMDEELEEDDQD